jgi:uncharacterized membrane protein
MRMTPKRFLSAPLGALAWTAAVLIVAGIVHIVSILAMPRLAPENPYARIATQTPVNQFVILPSVGPGAAALPYEDPASVLGACRFDLTRGPVRLRGQLLPESLVLLSFHSRYGRTFYAMTDRSALRGRIDVVVATRDQLDEIESHDNEDELPQELRLEAPTLQGFMLVRALAERPALLGEARERLSSLSCAG